MTRWRARISYDGTAFAGFQRQQARHRTIQGELERVVSRLSGRETAVIGAGRTDSGVHALGQVISFDMDWQHPSGALMNAINANLPEDIAILQLSPAAPTFHPRYDARRRAYRYTIDNRVVAHPVHRHVSWHVKRPLDIDLMNQAARHLIGKQNFATFGQPPKGNNTVREVYTAQWQQNGRWLHFDIEANAFLYRMVRSIVGSLKAVGEQRWTVNQFVAALQACDRSRSGTTAPPQGLFLMTVAYEQ